MWKRVTLCAIILSALLLDGQAGESQGAVESSYRPGAVLVQYRSRLDRESLLSAWDARVEAEIAPLRVLSLRVPAGREAATVVALRRDPRVAFAGLDYVASAADGFTPNDPGWTQQWGPQQIGAPLAWSVTVGNTATVIAVVDSGVTLSHPDLVDRLWVNAGEIPANGLDDDGNGQADDVWGWHFYHWWDGQAYAPGENNLVIDDLGHGTHVAGIAGATVNNGVGIAGIAGGCRLMAVKVLDQYGVGWYSDIAAGIVYAVDNGARIVNLSLGGSSPSEALQASVDYAHARGVLVVAAAGNDGGAVLYPAACQHALAVAATDRDDQHPSFSNHGPEVDVAAPGVDIYSTWPWRDGYFTKSGTSMAAPHVAGLAALIWSQHPDYTPDQVQQCITQTALDVGPPGWDEYAGWGRIDAGRAVVPHRVLLPLVCHGYYPSWWPAQ